MPDGMARETSEDIVNCLAPCLWAAFDRLNTLNGFAHHLKWQLDAFVATTKPVLEKRKSARRDRETPVLFSGISLSVSDLTDWPPDGGRRIYPSGGFGAREDEYLALADTMVRRNAAWTVALGWEAHETFIFDILASYLESHRAEADNQKLVAYSKKHSSPKAAQGWRDFVRWAYRGSDNKKVLACLRAHAPDFAKGETENNRVLDLRSWYQVLAKVRHAITHSGLAVPSKALTGRAEEAMLGKFFPGTATGNGYELKMGPEDTEQVLSYLMEHAFLIFKGLSIKAGYEWDVLGKSRKGITWASESTTWGSNRVSWKEDSMRPKGWNE